MVVSIEVEKLAATGIKVYAENICVGHSQFWFGTKMMDEIY